MREEKKAIEMTIQGREKKRGNGREDKEKEMEERTENIEMRK